ncbi:MAG: diaminopimelate epimerase [Cellulomonas sp.]|nr:diaminopimelate epimerase [Cellulomonas sp.]
MSYAGAVDSARRRLDVVKGHGTRNDFVLVDDQAGALDLTDDLVRALADRRGGVGGDGVIRLVASSGLAEGQAALAEDPAATWFMDYRNADGSIAQMCGNGVRVLAVLCARLGLWTGEELVLGTRAGVRRVRAVAAPAWLDDEEADEPGEGEPWYEVTMGPVTVSDSAQAGEDEVVVAGLHVPRPGLGVDVGNPHTVVALPDADTLARADLRTEPQVTPAPSGGVNVELVVPLGERLCGAELVGRVSMRVYERGVGETESCGTGAVAAAAAVRAWAGDGAPATWLVEVPGGLLRVSFDPDGTARLAGPAVLVADVTVDLAALGRPTARR